MKKKALLIIDMWDNHWCQQTVKQAKIIAPLINKTANKYRDKGHIIIHAPSGFKMSKYYKDYDQWIKGRPLHKYLNIQAVKTIKLPIYTSIDSCPDTNKMAQLWTNIHVDIKIHDTDFISNNAGLIFTLLEKNKVNEVYVCGLNLNMCILKNSYGIINLLKHGFNPVIIGKLTDVMYNPSHWPHVTVRGAKRIVINHIRKTYCKVI